jgi:hypothetical protein
MVLAGYDIEKAIESMVKEEVKEAVVQALASGQEELTVGGLRITVKSEIRSSKSGA